MMRNEEHAKEEVITLLEEQQEPYEVEVQDIAVRRNKAMRTLCGVVSAMVLIAGSVVGVEMLADKNVNGEPMDAMTLNVEMGSAKASAANSQFGWDTIKDGGCAIMANTWCYFKSDTAKCKDEYKNNCGSTKKDTETSQRGGGSGSGSGSGSDYDDSEEAGHPGNETETTSPPPGEDSISAGDSNVTPVVASAPGSDATSAEDGTATTTETETPAEEETTAANGSSADSADEEPPETNEPEVEEEEIHG
uniref:Uncharacterized protein n=1 Tax=Globisporangium ultimum (strain ATCC 200006 / CBS 805.95 / DAOM BR144) TaxID=431595 RepID=K3WQI8_GLOUD